MNQVVAPYREILEKIIVDDFTTKYRENNLNVSQQLNYNFILKDVESWIHLSDSYLYVKVKITRFDGTSMQNNDEATLTYNRFNFFRNAEYVISGKCNEYC